MLPHSSKRQTCFQDDGKILVEPHAYFAEQHKKNYKGHEIVTFEELCVYAQGAGREVPHTATIRTSKDYLVHPQPAGSKKKKKSVPEESTACTVEDHHT